jgi:pyrroloquinoline quinone (PQQ) biosynthesis protein C
MKVEELQNIKDKIKRVNDKQTKAQGAMEQIQTQLKKEFDLNTINEAEEKVKTLTKDKERDEARRDELLKELDSLTDWEALE